RESNKFPKWESRAARSSSSAINGSSASSRANSLSPATSTRSRTSPRWSSSTSPISTIFRFSRSRRISRDGIRRSRRVRVQPPDDAASSSNRRVSIFFFYGSGDHREGSVGRADVSRARQDVRDVHEQPPQRRAYRGLVQGAAG